MCLQQVLGRPLGAIPVICVTRRVDPQEISALSEPLRLVDRARVADEVPESGRGTFAVALDSSTKRSDVKPPIECSQNGRVK